MLPDIQPGNTKILYFFNCLLDGMHTNKIAPSFQFFLRNPAQKLLQCLSTPSKFYKCVEKDLGMRTGKIEILEDYFSKRLTLEAIYQSF